MTFRTVLLAVATACAVVIPAAAMAQDYGYGGYVEREYRDDRGFEFRRAEAIREREHEAWREAAFRRAAWREREPRYGWERDHRWSYGYDHPHPSYGYGYDRDAY